MKINNFFYYGRTGDRYIIHVYTKDYSYPNEQYQNCLDLLQLMINAIPQSEQQQAQGDFSAIVGDESMTNIISGGKMWNRLDSAMPLTEGTN